MSNDRGVSFQLDIPHVRKLEACATDYLVISKEEVIRSVSGLPRADLSGSSAGGWSL